LGPGAARPLRPEQRKTDRRCMAALVSFTIREIRDNARALAKGP
jgi:hypothetical protein